MAMKAALRNYNPTCTNLRAALFHSTTVLDRRRRTYWNYGGDAFRNSSQRYNYYSRSRKQHSKEEVVETVMTYIEYLFQSRIYDDDDDGVSYEGPSCFRKQRQNRERKWARRERKWDRRRKSWSWRGFQFCEDDGDEENPEWSNSSSYQNKYGSSWNWKGRMDEENDYSDDSELGFASHRKALGLSVSGPLKLEEVKNAYRTCAMKWHPDRHQGTSKAIAEEKFKRCSAAYETLCGKLAVA